MKRSAFGFNEYVSKSFSLFVPPLSYITKNSTLKNEQLSSKATPASNTPNSLLEKTVDLAFFETDTSEQPFLKSSTEESTAKVATIKNEDFSLLSAMLEEEICENGIKNPSEAFFSQLLANNKLEALNGLSTIFLSNYSTEKKQVNIAVSILHLISHLRYEQVHPNGQLIALAAINHKDKELAEYGIKCYENWAHKDGIAILKAVHFSTSWLQEYADQVIADLNEGE